jgi:hypothetical protein
MDGILLTWAKHLYDPIISIRGEVWDHTTSLALSLFIEVLVLSQESESLCICMLEVLIFLFDFSIGFWNCFDSVVFLAFISL